MCWKHYKQWQRKRGHLRCNAPNCDNHQDDGGRRMNGRFYCRQHEGLHLRVTEEAAELNLRRLGHNLTGDDNGCWLWYLSRNDGGYGTFVPEGANVAEWLTHRVVWDLLVGGHNPGLELDHRTCKRPNCASPLHLEPVSRSVNQRRKRCDADRSWINPDAANNQLVIDFALQYGLPLEAAKRPAATPHVVVRRARRNIKETHHS